MSTRSKKKHVRLFGCITIYVCCLLLSCCWSVGVHAKTVPCVEADPQKEGGWKLSSEEQCVQYTKTEATAIATKLIELKNLRLQVGLLRLEIDTKTQIITQWETVRYPSALARINLLESSLKDMRTQSDSWRNTSYQIAKLQKAPSWLEHPVLWLSVGILLGGVTVGVLSRLK